MTQEACRLLFLGDIFARPGREAVQKYLGELRAHYEAHAVIANVENAAHGSGITSKIARELFESGIDVMTSGNHIWDQKDIDSFFEKEPRLLRPLNDPPGRPGTGLITLSLPSGHRIRVINLMGKVFMRTFQDPWQCLEKILPQGPPRANDLDALILDFHGEASAEKQSFAYLCDGVASLVVGTHTHVPTADTRILPGGTGYQTDAGMCGVYHSVIGMSIASSLPWTQTQHRAQRFEPAQGEAQLAGLFLETDPATGLARNLERFCFPKKAHYGLCA